MKDLQNQIEKARQETEANRQKAFRNLGKDVKNIESYDNTEHLKLISKANKYLKEYK